MVAVTWPLIELWDWPQVQVQEDYIGVVSTLIPSDKDRFIMISWHGNNLCITGPLCGESTAELWIPLTKDQ